MTDRKWQVWSRDEKNRCWLVIDEGNRAEAVASASSKNIAARKYLGATTDLYIALPVGEEPNDFNIPELA